MPTSAQPSKSPSHRPPLPARFRTVRLVVELSTDVHEALSWLAARDAHYQVTPGEYVEDLVVTHLESLRPRRSA